MCVGGGGGGGGGGVWGVTTPFSRSVLCNPILGNLSTVFYISFIFHSILCNLQSFNPSGAGGGGGGGGVGGGGLRREKFSVLHLANERASL